MSFRDAIHAAQAAETYVPSNDEHARRQLAKAVQELAKSTEQAFSELQQQLELVLRALAKRS